MSMTSRLAPSRRAPPRRPRRSMMAPGRSHVAISSITSGRSASVAMAAGPLVRSPPAGPVRRPAARSTAVGKPSSPPAPSEGLLLDGRLINSAAAWRGHRPQGREQQDAGAGVPTVRRRCCGCRRNGEPPPTVGCIGRIPNDGPGDRAAPIYRAAPALRQFPVQRTASGRSRSEMASPPAATRPQRLPTTAS